MESLGSAGGLCQVAPDSERAMCRDTAGSVSSFLDCLVGKILTLVKGQCVCLPHLAP
jgi:hypothetical protein